MICSQCDRDNRPDSRFCLGCGVPLSRSCACGRELPGDALFCDGCGARVEAADAPSPHTIEPPTDAVANAADCAERFAEHGKVDEVFDDACEALRAADAAGDPGQRLAVRSELLSITAAADLELAVRYSEDALELLEPDESPASAAEFSLPSIGRFLWFRVCALVDAGRLEEALDSSARLASRLDGEHSDLCLTASAAARCHWLAGDYGAAMDAAREALDSNGVEASLPRSFARLSLAGALVAAGQPKDADAVIDEALEPGVAPVFMQPRLQALRVQTKIGLGETEAATRLARESLERVIDRGMRAFEAGERVGLAFAWLSELGADARDHVETELVALAELEGEGRVSLFDACRAIELRAALASAMGEVEASSLLLRTARARYQSMGATGRVAEIASRLKEIG